MVGRNNLNLLLLYFCSLLYLYLSIVYPLLTDLLTVLLVTYTDSRNLSIYSWTRFIFVLVTSLYSTSHIKGHFPFHNRLSIFFNLSLSIYMHTHTIYICMYIVSISCISLKRLSLVMNGASLSAVKWQRAPIIVIHYNDNQTSMWACDVIQEILAWGSCYWHCQVCW